MSPPPGYSPQVAQEAMALSAIAYSAEDVHNWDAIQNAIKTNLSQSPVLAGHYTLAWLGISADWSTLAYVAQDDRVPAGYAVVVRGTDWNFLADWVDDFDVLNTQPWPTAASSGAYVAQGAMDGLNTILGLNTGVTLTAFLQGAVAKVGPSGAARVLVSGHSLGGAMATVLGLWLSDNASSWATGGAAVSLTTYTFASPATGNQAYADYYNSRGAASPVAWQAFRVFNPLDVVPCAFGNIPHLPFTGIPFDFWTKIKVTALAAAVTVALDHADGGNGVSYTQVSNAVPLPAPTATPQCMSGTAPTTCPNPATSLEDFGCWACYEHTTTTYLALLQAPTENAPEHSLDPNAVAKAAGVLAATGTGLVPNPTAQQPVESGPT